MAPSPVPVSPPAPGGYARPPGREFESGADADGPGSAGGWLRALAFLALGVGLLWVGFLAVKPKPGTGAPRLASTATATTSPGPTGVEGNGPQPAALPAATPAASAAVQAPAQAAGAGAASPPPATATIAGGALVGNPIALRLTQGETAHLSLTADAPGELHLHGYDLERQTRPGQPVELRFAAGQTGRFPVEWHGPRHSHVEVGVVEVYPP